MQIAKKLILHIGGSAAIIAVAAILFIVYRVNSLQDRINQKRALTTEIRSKAILKKLSMGEAKLISSILDRDVALLENTASKLSGETDTAKLFSAAKGLLTKSRYPQSVFLKSGRSGEKQKGLYFFFKKEKGGTISPAKPNESFKDSISEGFSEKADLQLLLTETANGPEFTLLFPLKNGKKVKGFIALSYPTDFLKSLLHCKEFHKDITSIMSNKGEHASILNCSGYPLPQDHIRKKLTPGEEEAFVYVSKEKTGTRIFSQSLISSISTEKKQWFLYKSLLLEDLTTPAMASQTDSITPLQWTIVAITLIALLIFLAQVWYTSIKLVAPLKKTVEFSMALARGNFSVQLPKWTERNDEIGELIKSLSFMRDRFQHSIVKLKKSHRREKAAREEAESANHMKSDFLSNMSLELRNPLNSIMGFSNLIIKDLENGKYDRELHSKISAIYNSTEILNNLISNLLELSRLDSEDLETKPVEFDTSSFMKSISDFNLLTAKTKNISLENCYSADAPEMLFTDKDILIHIMNGLISSLIQVAPEKSTISFGCRSTSSKVILWVKDLKQKNISDSLADSFNEFLESGSETLQAIMSSTILNLTIAKANANLLGAAFQASKTAESNSLFQIIFNKEDIVLTVSPEDTASVHTATNWGHKNVREEILKEAPGIKEELSRKKEKMTKYEVLLAEDNEANRMLVELMLKNSEFNLESVNDGIECLDMLNRNKYDLLLLDLQMPNLDGYSVIKQIKKNNDLDEMPVIVLTAYLEEGDKEDLLLLGANECLLKPLDLDQVMSTMRKLI